MAGEKRNVLKGCIKAGKGPWLVHRTTKDGNAVTRFRYPSDRERQNNRRRECERRSVTRKIFEGLRAHGNYQLPKHSDTNDLLTALCQEAGWHVDEDGHISRVANTNITNPMSEITSLITNGSCRISSDDQLKDEEYCKCDSNINPKIGQLPWTFSPMASAHNIQIKPQN